MKSVLAVSTETYSGKTGIVLSLALALKERGRNVGYMKPVGNLPTRLDGHLTDEDAVFAARTLALSDPPERLCPVVLTSGASNEILKGKGREARAQVKSAYEALAAEHDLLLLEGPGHINDGRLLGLSAPEVAKLLGTRVLLVVKFGNPYEVADDMLVARDRLDGRLLGVLFNWVHPTKREILAELIVPYLESQGIRCFGIIPREESLLAVSVDSLAKALGGRVISAHDHLDEMVETFMVGAMGQEQALRFFRRKANKAVITGGDRADVQLAALETPTKCLILTGNYEPSVTVLGVAESKGVPVVVVDMDTLTAVERTEALVGKLRVHQSGKLEKIRAMLDEQSAMSKLIETIEEN